MGICQSFQLHRWNGMCNSVDKKMLRCIVLIQFMESIYNTKINF